MLWAASLRLHDSPRRARVNPASLTTSLALRLHDPLSPLSPPLRASPSIRLPPPSPRWKCRRTPFLRHAFSGARYSAASHRPRRRRRTSRRMYRSRRRTSSWRRRALRLRVWRTLFRPIRSPTSSRPVSAWVSPFLERLGAGAGADALLGCSFAAGEKWDGSAGREE